MGIKRQSLREQVRDLLLERISSGQISQGERIVESRLAKEMEISSIPIREAIRELITMGVLESEPHRGTWVRTVNASDALNAFESRIALETYAVKKAVRMLDESDDTLRQLAMLTIEAAQNRDLNAFQAGNHKFHLAIIEAANNPVMLQIWNTLITDIDFHAILTKTRIHDLDVCGQQHLHIANAIHERNAQQAAALLEQHNINFMHGLRMATSKLRQSPDDGHNGAANDTSNTPASLD